MIQIRIQDENGVADTEFPDADILDRLLSKAPATSKCLQFIDPYGDTIFNRHQAGVLADELEAATMSLKVPSERERAAALVAFVRQVAPLIHTYIKFVGD